MNNWGGREQEKRGDMCKLTLSCPHPQPALLRNPPSNVHNKSKQNIPCSYRKVLKIEKMVLLDFPLETWCLIILVCICAWVHTNACTVIHQGSVWGCIALTSSIPTRSPHSAAVHVGFCAYVFVCVQETERECVSVSLCVCVREWVGETVNEFYALLVSFKKPRDPQWKKRLLPCRLDPIQLLKDVEWLEQGQDCVRLCEADGYWRPLKASKHTTHTLLLYLVRLPWFLGNVYGQVEANLWQFHPPGGSAYICGRMVNMLWLATCEQFLDFTRVKDEELIYFVLICASAAISIFLRWAQRADDTISHRKDFM